MPRRLDPFKITDIRARDAEYQAMWQACYRTTRKVQYQAASVSIRTLMLHEALTNLIDKRRRQGKQMCGTSIDLMVDRHLRREAEEVREVSSPPPPPRQQVITAGPMDALNFLNHGSSAGLMLASPVAPIASMARPDVAPAVKTEPGSYRANIAQENLYPPVLEDTKHNSTLFNELTIYQAECSQLARQVHTLEKEVDNMKGMISILWNYLHPGMMMAPQTPSVGTGEEHHAVMD